MILAGISINMVLGENGIITKAKKAKKDTNVGQTDELINLSIMTAHMDVTLKNGKKQKQIVPESIDSSRKKSCCEIEIGN